MIAELTSRIEEKQFDFILKKLEPANDWNDASHTAWSAIGDASLCEVQNDASKIIMAWLNSGLRKWAKDCDAESKKQNLKDDDGNLLAAIVQCKGPLKQFAEASIRTKSSVFRPNVMRITHMRFN